MNAASSTVSDHELLADYAGGRSSAAFNELVSRHIDLVYTAALRQVRNKHLAEDVTQAVFFILSQRAGNISSQSVLPGWLLLTTRNVSRNALTQERRLKTREQKAAAMKAEDDISPISTSADAEAISPVLDEALSTLSEDDRNAIVNRFFQSKSHREVGMALGVSEEAASQRVLRALDKLRNVLAGKGVTTSQAALGAMLPIMAVKSAPPALLAVVHGSILSTPSFVAAIAKPVLGGKTVSAALMATCGAAVLAVAATVGVLMMQNTPAKQIVQAPVAPPTVVAPPPVVAVAETRTLTISVIDSETNKPVEGAEVMVRRNGNNGNWVKADATGKATVPIPANNDYLTIQARAPGRVPSTLSTSSGPFRGDQPNAISFPISQSTIIGGIVVDENGNPVPDAKVSFTTYSNYADGIPEPMLSDVSVTTDTEGRWTMEAAPKDIGRLAIAATRSDININGSYTEYSADDLKKEQARIVIVKGKPSATRTGVVVDPDGKPVAGATVTWTYSHYESKPPTAKTDAAGSFTISARPDSGSNPILVTAKGYAPFLISREAASAQQTQPLSIKLEKPSLLEGQIVDHDGKPIKGASIEISTWRDSQALGWKAKTDAEGNFKWPDAPSDMLRLTVTAKGRSYVNSYEVTPGQGLAKITMLPQLELAGTVTDADTHEPIKLFKITYGTRGRNSNGEVDVNISWQSSDGREIANGKYEATISDFTHGGHLRVEAAGYLPAVSRLIEAKESLNGKVTVNFELKKGTGPTGVVVDADNKPVPNVDVIIMPKSGYSIDIDNPSRMVGNVPNASMTKADADGKFAVNPIEGDVLAVVSCDAGFQIVAGLKNGGEPITIKLQKWGTIEGIYRLNAGVLANGQLVLAPHSNQIEGIYLNANREISTDSDGRFVFSRIPPGKGQIGRKAQFSNGYGYLNTQLYDIGEGQTLTMNLGGKGRPVIGKFELPADVLTRAPYNSSNFFSFTAQSTSEQTPVFNAFDVVEYPANYADMTSVERRKWQKEYLDKPKMAAMAKAMMQSRSQQMVTAQFKVNSDGSFRADDVIPGNYTANVQIQSEWVNGRQREMLAKLQFSFVVPETPAVPTDEPIDVGTVTPASQAVAGVTALPMQVGQSLPEQNLVTVDGQPVKIEQFKGKTLVIHTWHLDGQKMFDAIAGVEKQYAGNDKVVVLHVGFDTLTPWAKRIAEKNSWTGINAIGASESRKQSNPAAWVRWQCSFAAPECLIVDSEGKLVARTNKPDELLPAVAKAVAK